MSAEADSEFSLEGVTLAYAQNVLRVSSREPLRVLGSPDIGDDLALTRNIVIMSRAAAQAPGEPERDLHDWALQAGIQEPYVGVLTAGNAGEYVQATAATAKWQVTVLLCADLGARSSAGLTRPGGECSGGSIDIIVLTDASLAMGAMVNAIVTATEAKARTLAENRIRAGDDHVATGAPADSVVVGCLSRGERIRRAGPTTQIGHLIGKLVHRALTDALRGQRAS